MGKRKRKRWHKHKEFVEIYTSKNHWKRVELIKNKGSIIIIKLPSGEIIGRKNKRVRPIVHIVSSKYDCTKNSYTKKFRSKKKRKKRFKRTSNKRIVVSNKWRDPKKLRPEDYKEK